MRLRFNLSCDDVMGLLHQAEIQRGMRPVYFQHLVRQSSEFEFDSFNADWAIECFMAQLAETLASGAHTSVESALREMASEKGMKRLADIPASLFQPDTEMRLALTKRYRSASINSLNDRIYSNCC